jgi:hypothetical protein
VCNLPKVKSKDGLTVKQRKALSLYQDPNSTSYLNATQSIKQVYDCNSNSARSMSTSVITNNIAKLDPSKLYDPILKEKVTADWIVKGISQIANTARRSADRLKALELLGKFKELSLWREHNISEQLPTTSKESMEDLNREFKEYISSITSVNTEIVDEKIEEGKKDGE